MPKAYNHYDSLMKRGKIKLYNIGDLVVRNNDSIQLEEAICGNHKDWGIGIVLGVKWSGYYREYKVKTYWSILERIETVTQSNIELKE